MFSKDVRTYISDAYQAFDKWNESLPSEILQKTNISTHEKIVYKLIRMKYAGSLHIDVKSYSQKSITTYF